MRLIDADALIEYLKKMWSKWDEDDWYEAQAKDAMKDDIEIVNKQPTVDAVTVHGEWLSEWEGLEITVRCSVCGEMALIKEGGSHDHAHSHYCPNCGAKMDRKENADADN